MNVVIGIDGGGTKTAFALGNNQGILRQIEKSGSSYLEIGKEAVVELIVDGIKELMEGLDNAVCTSVCMGLPCIGENNEMDQWLFSQLCSKLAPAHVHLVNDAVVGWAGALQKEEGIHLVAGTGSLAIGKGTEDHFVRAGGWNEFFGDEGSCYWIGREAMTLFSKQADGRVEKGALYHLVKEKFQLNDDFEFIDVVLNQLAPYRDQVASFQRIALQAAEQGDASVIQLYEKAADELVQMVKSVKAHLTWKEDMVSVSIFGGLTHAGSLVMAPLRKKLSEINCILEMPKSSAVEGAMLLALKHEKNI